MSDSSIFKIIEDQNSRIAQLNAENLALRQVITAILSAIPPEQATRAKKHVNEINDFVLKGGSAAAVELLEAQKPVYQQLFLHVK
ncbi:hypothetical protein [Serratia marcescens]|uniref:hypothetical protein n=1 Tax=Serratia marcescens TaxID=615 RepID=UPI001F14E6C9|nr:hypothetical protein [Serratia marcescens]